MNSYVVGEKVSHQWSIYPDLDIHSREMDYATRNQITYSPSDAFSP